VYKLKLLLTCGIGYMIKSLIVTFGVTTENLVVNLVLLIGLIACLVAVYPLED
jgi:hypothetical protein